MPGREPLSVVVITLNEARNLDRCLASVAWADERVVVDSGSTDGTEGIARRHGARFVLHPWEGFAGQKNFAISAAAHPWVLSLDADEWVDADGAAEIRRILESPRAGAYAFDRLSSFCGGFVRHAWSPDRHVRLFRKGTARFEGGHVHESLRIEPGTEVARLSSPLYHLTYRSVREHVDRMNRYTDLAARTLVERGRPFRRSRLFLSPLAAFAKHYAIKGGYRDGVRGFLVAAGAAYYVLLKYAKAWDATRGEDPEFAGRVPPTPEDPRPGAVSAP